MFPTKEELMAMPLKRLRTIDVHNLDEEKLLQEVIDSKAPAQPISDKQVYRNDIPDIKTKEEEEKWQKVVNEREEKLRPKIEISSDDSGIQVKIGQEVSKSIDEEIVKKEEELKVIKEEISNTSVKCNVCGKQLKNEAGLRLHKGKFHK